MCPFCGKNVGVLYSCIIRNENKLACCSCGNLTYHDRLEKGGRYFEVNRLLKKRHKVIAKMRKTGIRSKTYFKNFEQYEQLNREIEIKIGIEELENSKREYGILAKCYELISPEKQNIYK